MRTSFILGSLLSIGIAVSAHAAIVAGPTINGLNTFEDTSTGVTWLDFNDFFNESSQQMVATATAAGFTWADYTAVSALLSDMPLDSGQWSAYSAVTGSAPNRQLIWAAYGPATNGIDGYAYAYGGDNAWSTCPNCDSVTTVENGGGRYADMNIFAYQTGVADAPEPASAAVLGVGLSAAALRRRRRPS